MWVILSRIIPGQVGIQGSPDDLGHRQTFGLGSQCQLSLLACRDIDVNAYFVHLVPLCLTYSIMILYNDSREMTKGQETMLIYEYKVDGSKAHYAAIDEAIRTTQFIRNKCLRLWMDTRGIS